MTDQNPDDLTDTQLDELLAAANGELLDHVKNATNSSRFLAALLSRDVPPATISEQPTGRDHSQAAAAISLRIRARYLATFLDLDIPRHLDRDLDANLNLALALARYVDRASDLARDLARDLDSYLGLVSDLDRARPSYLAVANVLTRAHLRADALARHLEAKQVDASGVDLSSMEITSLQPLSGVIWTPETTWPPSIDAQVRNHSNPIGPGVYRIDLGNAPDRDPLTLA